MLSSSEGVIQGSLRMKPDGVKQSEVTLVWRHQQRDLRTSEYDSLGSPLPEAIHDPQEKLF
jgi:hypothetical protein